MHSWDYMRVDIKEVKPASVQIPENHSLILRTEIELL